MPSQLARLSGARRAGLARLDVESIARRRYLGRLPLRAAALSPLRAELRRDRGGGSAGDRSRRRLSHPAADLGRVQRCGVRARDRGMRESVRPPGDPRVKIVHLLGWYFPDSVGGTEVYVEALCRRLRAAGHDVLVAAPNADHAAPERYEHRGVRVFRYQIAGAPTRDEAQHRLPVRGVDRLYRFLADERPDILHLHSFTTGV